MESDRATRGLDELWAMIEQQQEEIQRQRAEIDRLRSTQAGRPERRRGHRLSRAGLLKAAVAGSAGLAGLQVLQPQGAEATQGSAVIAGQSNTATAPTTVDTSASMNVRALEGLAGGGNSIGVLGQSSGGYGVYGSGGAYGVYGDSGSGIGGKFQSDSYFGGWFSGGLAPIYLLPAGTAGAPTTGNHWQGEIYVDSNGVFWICTAGNGTNVGTWNAVVGAGLSLTATGTTYIDTTSGSANGLEVSSKGADSALLGQNTDGTHGVTGANTTGDGVFGISTSGNGVYGTSTSGYGVYGTSTNNAGGYFQSSNNYGGWFGGGLAPIYLQPAGSAGAPTTGNHYKGEIYVDSAGVSWVCTAGDGTNVGTWNAVVAAGLSVTAKGTTVIDATGSGSIGLSVLTTGASASTAVKGQNDTGAGVIGLSTSSAGVFGGSKDASGVAGNSINGVSVQGQSANYFGGWFSGGLAPIYLQPHGTAGAPTTGTHYMGEIYVDSAGVFWVCVAGDGTGVGTWKSLSSVVPIPNVRVLNTRPAHQIGPYTGPIDNNSVLTLTLAGTNGIPANATGVIGNLTAADATAGCFLALVPSGANHVGVSSVNFPALAPGSGVANSFTVGLSSDGKVDIYTGNCSVYTVNIIMDVVGYIV